MDPNKTTLLMARFISRERSEPPDIDVDFEHARRETVIQYIYEKYGRGRAALTAVVSCWRTRGALRDAGKALGVDAVLIDAMARQHHWFSDAEDQAAEPEPEPDDPALGWVRSKLLRLARLRERLGDDCPQLSPQRARLWLELALQLRDSPRHLSQHVGGFVLTDGPLTRLVPVEPAAMEGRSVIQWDKDDLDTMKLLKVDVLALGMLTVLRGSLHARAALRGPRWELADIPKDDPATYDMICRADTVGTFQIESRAQMSMLPRLRPRQFYDLVIEVAIVRPGPIQGDMVHPYLRRRNGQEVVSFPSDALGRVLGKTLGVPLFQEQAMQIAIIGAGFTPTEADRLRRSLATVKKHGSVSEFHDRFLQGMAANGYEADFAARCFAQIEGFGSYGFPESHAASFALLVYASAWIKRHHPGIFACALLNSQPMGFYAPAQIVRDAREHGVVVLPPSINASHWDNVMEKTEGALALRLGFRQIKGLSEEEAMWIIAARGNGYLAVEDVWRRAGASPTTITRLRCSAAGKLP